MKLTTFEDYVVELQGIVLLLICIIGCCPFGPVADVIKGFASFIAGVWWAEILILVGICGVFMIKINGTIKSAA